MMGPKFRSKPKRVIVRFDEYESALLGIAAKKLSQEGYKNELESIVRSSVRLMLEEVLEEELAAFYQDLAPEDEGGEGATPPLPTP